MRQLRAAQLLRSVHAQEKPAVTFEVISIKSNRSGEVSFRNVTKGRAYTATNTPLRHVIAAAYAVPVARVLGGPSWLGAPGVDLRFVGGDRFDIVATLPDGATLNLVPAMLRAMLAERFKLTAHTEMRDSSIYALVMAQADGRLGPQGNSTHLTAEEAAIPITTAVAASSSPSRNSFG